MLNRVLNELFVLLEFSHSIEHFLEPVVLVIQLLLKLLILLLSKLELLAPQIFQAGVVFVLLLQVLALFVSVEGFGGECLVFLLVLAQLLTQKLNFLIHMSFLLFPNSTLDSLFGNMCILLEVVVGLIERIQTERIFVREFDTWSDHLGKYIFGIPRRDMVLGPIDDAIQALRSHRL